MHPSYTPLFDILTPCLPSASERSRPSYMYPHPLLLTRSLDSRSRPRLDVVGPLSMKTYLPQVSAPNRGFEDAEEKQG
ncbi:hypothetical protein WN55_08158 [Dufourea novaeangliae]|uniref:Uncharacterized protein n=1 Tax=Dufourea novaeangliae TaxID=178035 RepID=A0A154P4Z4_DUFNO|nr:hypothetical protein WN55_08158 [Dufourea novaeangliae]